MRRRRNSNIFRCFSCLPNCFVVVVRSVIAQEPESVLQAVLVLLAIFLWDISPCPGRIRRVIVLPSAKQPTRRVLQRVGLGETAVVVRLRISWKRIYSAASAVNFTHCNLAYSALASFRMRFLRGTIHAGFILPPASSRVQAAALNGFIGDRSLGRTQVGGYRTEGAPQDEARALGLQRRVCFGTRLA